MLRVQVVRHVPFEGLGYLKSIFENRGWKISETHLYQNDQLPEISSFDFLVIMGGPMGVNDEERFPWLKQEKAFLKSTIDGGKKVLGICLGAQLAASVLGASVKSNPQKEIGWFPVHSLEKNPYFPHEFTPLHWHGDTFEIPAGGRNLVKSLACENQAFVWGQNLKNQVLGLQFHLEIMDSGIQSLIDNCNDHKEEGEFIQSAQELVASDTVFQGNWAIVERIIEAFIS